MSSRTTAAPSAVELEATGGQDLVAQYEGREFTLPAEVDGWPLDLIAASVGMRAGRLVADHGVIVHVLSELLGKRQWPGFLEAFPRRRQLAPASCAFAAAAGFPAREDDLAFGALPRLLAVLAEYPDAVEATLGELGIDYRDRWRFDEAGRRRLTLRQLHVRLSYTGPDSPLGIAQNGGTRPFNGTEILLMDVFEVLARTRHPSRPMSAEALAARASKEVALEAERAAYRERHKVTSIGGRRRSAIETARANARLGKGTA